MDSRNPSFLPVATYNDGSCLPLFEGCTDADAYNYRPLANWDDGSCKYSGCADSSALNFVPGRRIDLPGACIGVIVSCAGA